MRVGPAGHQKDAIMVAASIISTAKTIISQLWVDLLIAMALLLHYEF
jgi:hypothetical protein